MIALKPKRTFSVSKYFALAILCCVAGSSVQAADVKPEVISLSITQAASDPVKLKAYCDMAKKMDEVGDDDKKAQAAGDEIDGYIKTLGKEFEVAWNAGQDAADKTPEAKAYDDAMTELDAKCPK